MAKVTSKRQVTVPKAVADRYGIKPGTELDWQPAGDAIRVVPAGESTARKPDPATRLALFDAATARQRARQRDRPRPKPASGERGWSRSDLYADRERGGTR